MARSCPNAGLPFDAARGSFCRLPTPSQLQDSFARQMMQVANHQTTATCFIRQTF
jgi:hypothetical protein